MHIHALPCLRYESKTGKPMHLGYLQNPASIGEHIKKRRMDLKLFQSDVAKIFNVSTDCVTYWENNRSTPRIIFYPKIMEFLGYSPLDFDETTLSGRIKAYRYRNGITSKMFGNMLKVDPSTITEWENGIRVPAPKHLLKLEILLNKVNKF